MQAVLESAARFHDDHVVDDLRGRFDAVLDALERDDGWALNRVVPGKLILGELGGIETGVRQMIRTRPLEVEDRRWVRDRLASCLERSGLTQAEFARRLGTSPPRLSTYLTGRVTPAATVLARAERIVRNSAT